MNSDLEDEPEDSPFDAVLDDDQFDVETFVNKRFPTDSSLRNGLNSLVKDLEVQSNVMRESMVRSVRRQAVYGERSMRGLEDAKDTVSELFVRMAEIQVKARETQQLVDGICKNIRSLDHQKRRLNISRVGLMKLSMLITCVEEGRKHARNKAYKELAPYAAGMNRIDLDDLGEIEPMAKELIETKSKLSTEISKQLMEEYDSIWTTLADDVSLRDTKAAYCVDAMPSYLRREILTRFTLKYLEEYKRIFQPPQEASQLEVADRRFAWLTRKLREYDDRYAVNFPKEWMVPCNLCELFCHITRQHLVEVLGACHATCDPEALVKILRKSIHFENEMATRFDGQRPSKLSIDRSVLKYPEVLEPLPQEPEEVVPRFRGIVSECFEVYLGSWVRHEEQKLVEFMYQEITKETYETHVDDGEGDEKTLILCSSAEQIFVAMEQILKKCTQFSKHQTLFEVFLSFQRVLDLYAAILFRRLPTTATLQVFSAFTDDDCQSICAVIGTTEYVDSTLAIMQDRIETIIDPAFRVSFDSTLDAFGTLTTKAFSALVLTCEVLLDPCFTQMSTFFRDFQTKQRTLEQDKDEESRYLHDISRILTDHFTKVCNFSSHLHYRFFCDKFAEMFIPKFFHEARKIRKTYPLCVERLLADVAVLKTMLLEVPVVAAAGQSTSTAYSSFVVREMDKAAEALRIPGSSAETTQDMAQRFSPIDT